MQACHWHNKTITAHLLQLFSPRDEKKGVWVASSMSVQTRLMNHSIHSGSLCLFSGSVFVLVSGFLFSSCVFVFCFYSWDCLCLCLCVCEKLSFSFQTGSDLHTACYINDKGDKVKKFVAKAKQIQMLSSFKWNEWSAKPSKLRRSISGLAEVQPRDALHPVPHNGDQVVTKEMKRIQN